LQFEWFGVLNAPVGAAPQAGGWFRDFLTAHLAGFSRNSDSPLCLFKIFFLAEDFLKSRL
jgi:hypothetical protein